MILGKNERDAIHFFVSGSRDVDSTFFDSIVTELREWLDAPCTSSISMVDPFLPLPTLLSQFAHFSRTGLDYYTFTRPISRDISSLSPPVLRPRSISPHFCLLLYHTSAARTAFSCDRRPRSLLRIVRDRATPCVCRFLTSVLVRSCRFLYLQNRSKRVAVA